MKIAAALGFAALISVPSFAQTQTPPAPPPADVLGAWDAVVNSQQGPIEAKIELSRTGEKIGGTLTSHMGSVPIEAEVKAKTLAIWFDFQGQSGPIAIELDGTVEGDAIKGTMMVGGQASGDWTATRAKAASAPAKTAAPPALTTAASAAPSLTGDWVATVELPGMTANPSMMLKQDGEKLTGEYVSAQYGKFPIAGTVKGADIAFSFSMSIEGNAFDVSYTGAVQKDGTLKGAVNYGDMMSGTFSATRKK